MQTLLKRTDISHQELENIEGNDISERIEHIRNQVEALTSQAVQMETPSAPTTMGEPSMAVTSVVDQTNRRTQEASNQPPSSAIPLPTSAVTQAIAAPPAPQPAPAPAQPRRTRDRALAGLRNLRDRFSGFRSHDRQVNALWLDRSGENAIAQIMHEKSMNTLFGPRKPSGDEKSIVYSAVFEVHEPIPSATSSPPSAVAPSMTEEQKVAHHLGLKEGSFIVESVEEHLKNTPTFAALPLRNTEHGGANLGDKAYLKISYSDGAPVLTDNKTKMTIVYTEHALLPKVQEKQLVSIANVNGKTTIKPYPMHHGHSSGSTSDTPGRGTDDVKDDVKKVDLMSKKKPHTH